jgi:hypothetical protein
MEVMWSLCGDGYQPRTAYIPDPGRSVSPSQVRPDMALFSLLPATLDGHGDRRGHWLPVIDHQHGKGYAPEKR